MYLRSAAYIFLDKSRVGVILDVASIDVVLEMIESVVSLT